MKPLYKNLIIFGLLIIAGALIYLGWQKLTKEPTPGQTAAPENIEGDATSTNAGLEPVADKESPTSSEFTPGISPRTSASSAQSAIRLEKISKNPILDFWVSADTQEVYYIAENGKVFSLKSGAERNVSQQEIKDIFFTLAGPKSERLFALFGDPKNPWGGVYDTVNNAWRPLPQGIQTATWTDSDEKLIAILRDGKINNLVEFNLTKNPPEYKTLIRGFNFKDVLIEFKPPNILSVIEKPTALYGGRVWQLDLESLTITALTAPENGLMLRFWPRENVVFKFSSPQNFFVLNNSLEPLLPVPFSTLPQKCAAAKETIYCFVPNLIPDAVTLPDDYLERGFYSIDNLFVANQEDSSLRRIDEKSINDYRPFDATSPEYYLGNLYFINRYDGFLYKLAGDF